MWKNNKPLPIGVDDFKKLIDKGYYFVDKSLYIKDLLDMQSEVTLITRPRRFGKTLNMSMLIKQIDNKNYDTELIEEGYEEIIKYGISFFKKKCRIFKKWKNKNKLKRH